MGGRTVKFSANPPVVWVHRARQSCSGPRCAAACVR